MLGSRRQQKRAKSTERKIIINLLGHKKEMTWRHVSRGIIIYIHYRNVKMSLLLLQFSAPYPPFSIKLT